MTGLYYYGARYYSSREGIFLGCDPLMEKYPSLSPFAYCVNNPIKYIDPDGKEVKPMSSTAFNLILWSVSPEESKYVRYDANGYIDKDYLNQGLIDLGSVGKNFSSLMSIAQDTRIMEVYTSNKFETNEKGEEDMGQPVYESTFDAMYEIEGEGWGLTKEEYSKMFPQYTTEKMWSGKFGQTLYPDEGHPGTTKNGNMQVIINNNIENMDGGLKQMTSIFAHEAYGHVLFKILNLPHSHGTKMKSMSSDSPGNNKALEIQIFDRENEAEKNYELQNK